MSGNISLMAFNSLRDDGQRGRTRPSWASNCVNIAPQIDRHSLRRVVIQTHTPTIVAKHVIGTSRKANTSVMAP